MSLLLPALQYVERTHICPIARFILASTLLAAGTLGAPFALAQGGPAVDRAELVLSNLPPKGSKSYKDLLRLAGTTANGQVLSFTQAEVWSMPSSRIETVMRKGETLGVKITRLGRDWNQVLKAPSGPMPMSTAQETMLAGIERSGATTAVGMMTAPNEAVVEYALMKDHDRKSAIGARPASLVSKITVPLNDKETITVRRTSVDMRRDGCTWRGEIDGTGEPVIIMWWKGGRMTGMFTYRGHMYTLMNMGGELHAVVETDPRRMPPDHAATHVHGAGQAPNTDVRDDPLVATGEGDLVRSRNRENRGDRQDAIAPKEATPNDSSPPQIVPMTLAERQALASRKFKIDLMVLYTSKVAAKYIDVDADLIHLSIEQANQSFAGSGIGNIELHLVHQQSIAYDESNGEHFDHLYRMVDGVGEFSKVRALRNEKRADIVALIVDDPSGCGLSTRVAADADEAYVVVHHSCAALTYSLAHEIGHIIGARHDRALDQNVAPFPYGHGYVNGSKWRDIMSYQASCHGCPRLPIWSNPTIMFKGEPTGTVDADNARVILEEANRVSKFR
jgi:hypothetical protein